MACSQCAAENHAEPTSLERVRYFPRQLLTADDMRTEQEYFREKLRRHNRFLHGWGVVCGLEVVRDPVQAMKVKVCPGYALGPWGDEIYVEEPAELDLSYCARPAAAPCDPQHGGVVQPIGRVVVLLVKIRYAECPSRPMRTLPAGCGCDETACEYSRIRDGFEIQCAVKGTAPTTRPRDVNREVPACLPCPTDPWIVLAEVETTGAFTIRNEVRRVIANTPALAGS
jgi:hypothetical protein